MIKHVAIFFLLTCVVNAQESDPAVKSWIINLDGSTGYNGIPTNVQLVMYNATDVWVSSTCIPGYDIGPWAGNPNVPANQNFTFRITRIPVRNDGARVATALGHIGVWKNGVSIFNQRDARSYNNQRVWNQNALYFEGNDFDTCLGHPAPNGEYHHHVNPRCLWDDTDTSHHAPLLGYAFDGFPIYGGYAYKEVNGTGDIIRLRSSYRIREIADRTTLPNGTVLASDQYGPEISSQYELGAFCEDFEFVEGHGDLDVHNGRFCITPDYPSGTYAYFVTLDEQGEPAYPYVIGTQYYGVLVPGNTGPQSGHTTPAPDAVQYFPTTVSDFRLQALGFSVSPNPARELITITSDKPDFSYRIVDQLGSTIDNGSAASFSEIRSVAHLPSGAFHLILENDSGISTIPLVIVH